MQDLLPAGRLRLFREGVVPSGSLQKVSGYISILLLRPLPDASSIRLQTDTAPYQHALRRVGCLSCGPSSGSPMSWWWGYTETVSPRPPRLHRISTTSGKTHTEHNESAPP